MKNKCIIRWNDILEKHWDSYLDQAPYAAYQQYFAYGEVARRLGAQPMRAIIEWDSEVVGVAQFIVRTVVKLFTFAIVLRGPVWLTKLDDEIKAECYLKLKQALNLNFPKLVFFMPETNDYTALRKAKLRQVISSYSTSTIDLVQDKNTLLAKMDSKWRNRLNVARKQDLIIKPVSLKSNKYEWLLAKEAEQAIKAGYKALPPELVPIYQECSGQNSLLILRAIHNNDTVGGMLLLLHGKNATYHIGWSSDTGKKLGAHNLLLWEAVITLKAKHIHTLDLGGINTETSGVGIARFKLGLSNNITQLPGTYM